MNVLSLLSMHLAKGHSLRLHYMHLCMCAYYPAVGNFAFLNDGLAVALHQAILPLECFKVAEVSSLLDAVLQ